MPINKELFVKEITSKILSLHALQNPDSKLLDQEEVSKNVLSLLQAKKNFTKKDFQEMLKNHGCLNTDPSSV